jgi:hypothetical protein
MVMNDDGDERQRLTMTTATVMNVDEIEDHDNRNNNINNDNRNNNINNDDYNNSSKI